MMSDERAGSSIDDRGLDRILSLSDGIFAFAITLLVLNLTLPTLNQAATSSTLLSSLWTERSKFIAYIVSFYVISSYWLAHHRVFRYVKRYDGLLIQLNLLFLLFITIVPFFTQLISTYGNLEAAEDIFYLSQAFGGVLLTFLWIHASRDFLLIEDDTPQSLIRWVTVRGLISPSVFLAAAVVSLFVPSYSSLTLIAIAPVSRILFRKYGYKRTPESQKGDLARGSTQNG
jgi:TMEM175 potassium channel family protein